MMNHEVAYFLASLLVEDNQLNIDEATAMEKFLIEEFGEDGAWLTTFKKIIENADDAISAEEILSVLKKREPSDRWAAIQLGMAYCSNKGSWSSDETGILRRAVEEWGITVNELRRLQKIVEKRVSESAATSLSQVSSRRERESSRMNRMLQKINRPMRGDSGTGQTDASKAFMKSQDYEAAIKFCEAIANADLDYAEPVLHRHMKTLDALRQAIVKIADDIKENPGDQEISKEMNQIMDGLKESTRVITTDGKKRVTTFLRQKRKAVPYFTISFLGKTKAGKSTLHAVLSGEGKEAIGVGTQRTTRRNRMYQWENLRIVDTPGIGAPGGQSDEEIARSILEESDLICYVLKNDSIQEKEFEILSEIKKRNKPIIILLNIKSDLKHSSRFRKFLENPEHIYDRKDSKSIAGHINRIRKYAKQHYANDIFEIVPVHLYAAFLSMQETYTPKERKILRTGSHLEHFENAIKSSIIKEGHIRKSQTILNGLIYPMLESQTILSENQRTFKRLHDKLTKLRKDSNKKMNNLKKKYEKRFSEIINQQYLQIEEKISSFASANYTYDKKEVDRRWKKLLEDSSFFEGLESSIMSEMERYAKEIEEYMKEMLEDMSYGNLKIMNSLDIDTPSLFDFKRFFGYTAALGGVASAVAGLIFGISNPVGWIIGGVVLAVSLFGMFFKSKARKIQEAIESLEQGLKKSVAKQKDKTNTEMKKSFHEIHRSIQDKLTRFQGGMIEALENVSTQLEVTLDKTQQQIDELNKAFAYRLLTSANPVKEQMGPLRSTDIEDLIKKVERDFGKTLVIHTHKEAVEERFLMNLTSTVQEQITVKHKGES